MTFDQRRASSSAAASPRLMPIHSAVMVTAANAMPKHARMMWNPSDDPICDRAGTASTARTCATAPIPRPPPVRCIPAARLQSPHAMCTATALRVHTWGSTPTFSQRCIGHMSGRNVGAVALTILLGLVIGTLGLVAADLYAVGVLILFLGGVGAAVLSPASTSSSTSAAGDRPPDGSSSLQVNSPARG